MTRQEEVQAKLDLVRELLGKQGLSGMLLSTQANFAWLTGGADNHVALCSEGGVASLVVTPTGQFCVTNNIEEPRILDEEIGEIGLFETHSAPWFEDQTAALIRKLGGDNFGCDTADGGGKDVSKQLAKLRWQLLPNEITRYRQVGKETGRILAETAREIEPGWRENYIAALMAYKTMAVGLTPHVALVATDERISKYRHPIPTDKPLHACAELIIGARRWGLGISATRMVYFGTPPEELMHKHQAVCEVDARMILATHPGMEVSRIFAIAMDTYSDALYPEEWKLHHQGGATGYAPREYKATLTSREKVLEDQAFAWNPSITGTKSEDTIIARADYADVLSASPGWPTISVQVEGLTLDRPNILVR